MSKTPVWTVNGGAAHLHRMDGKGSVEHKALCGMDKLGKKPGIITTDLAFIVGNCTTVCKRCLKLGGFNHA
jgi:hypothetical protein